MAPAVGAKLGALTLSNAGPIAGNTAPVIGLFFALWIPFKSAQK